MFAAGLYRVIRRAEGKDGWLAIASLASAVGGAGIFGAGTALFMVVAYRPATDPAVARAFWDAGWLAYNTAGFGFVAWIALVAAATLKHRVLPQWTAWVAAPIALISFAGPFGREDRKRPVLSAGLVRRRCRARFRRMAHRHLLDDLATDPRTGHNPVTIDQLRRTQTGPAISIGLRTLLFVSPQAFWAATLAASGSGGER